MILASHVEVHLLPLLWLVVIWAIALQALSAFLLQFHSRALVAWSIGVFGVSAIYLWRPNSFLRFLQVLLPITGAGGVAYVLLSVTTTPPVTGLMDTTTTRLWIAAGGTLILSVPRFVAALAELRFPLWGEAGVLDRVARGRALGNIIYFTTLGRTYLRERFNATPNEFLQIVRRRPPSVAHGS